MYVIAMRNMNARFGMPQTQSKEIKKNPSNLNWGYLRVVQILNFFGVVVLPGYRKNVLETNRSFLI